MAAKGSAQRIEELIHDFRQNKITVFQGDYIGVDPEHPDDRIDLSEGYVENETSSAPTFHYILQDVITIE